MPHEQLINGFYNLPPITIPKVTGSELLAIIRLSVNDGYMPSAKGITTANYNSKPTYVQKRDKIYTSFPAFPFPAIAPSNDFYSLVDEYGYSHPDAKIFLYLGFERFQLMINLTTEEILVRGHSGDYVSDVFIWEQDKPLPLEIFKFGTEPGFFL